MPLFIVKTRLPSQKWCNRSSLCKGSAGPPELLSIHQVQLQCRLQRRLCPIFCDPQDHTLLNFFMERAGGASPCKFWTSTIKRILYFIIGILRLRAIDWYINEFNPRRSGGGGGQGGFDFLGPPLQNFTGAFYRNYKYIFGIFSSSPVDWHPF